MKMLLCKGKSHFKTTITLGLGMVFAITLILHGCKPESNSKGYEAGEENQGGTTTTFDYSQNAFSHPAPHLSDEDDTRFNVGNSFFNMAWVMAPASTTGADGLGPLYNATSCSGCHSHDGRGRAPVGNENVTGLLFRLSVPGTDAHGGPAPHPVYGGQFQNLSIPGVEREGGFAIGKQPVTGTFEDGTPYTLYQPVYTLNGNYGPLDGVAISPRVGPQMIGLGLLDAITLADLQAHEDVNDANGDGISGRINYVWDVAANMLMPGRFGWKANQPNLTQQVAGAFNGDLGITSSMFPHDHCTSAQNDCNNAPNGNDSTGYELTAKQLDRVTFYSATLSVPGRRDAKNEAVLKGKLLFNNAGCTGCHVASYTTGPHTIAAVSNQKIYPYTDLLLHDMGSGLADGYSDYMATGNEWRTPPLWGIGLFSTVNGHTFYLHDGRAANLTEAILWHGGEAEKAKENFRKMSAQDREALLQFLNSL